MAAGLELVNGVAETVGLTSAPAGLGTEVGVAVVGGLLKLRFFMIRPFREWVENGVQKDGGCGLPWFLATGTRIRRVFAALYSRAGREGHEHRLPTVPYSLPARLKRATEWVWVATVRQAWVGGPPSGAWLGTEMRVWVETGTWVWVGTGQG